PHPAGHRAGGAGRHLHPRRGGGKRGGPGGAHQPAPARPDHRPGGGNGPGGARGRDRAANAGAAAQYGGGLRDHRARAAAQTGAADQGDLQHCPRRDRVDLAGGRRDRDHEHHAGVGAGADPRDRGAPRGGCHREGHPVPVPDGGGAHQRHRRVRRHRARRGAQPGDRARRRRAHHRLHLLGPDRLRGLVRRGTGVRHRPRDARRPAGPGHLPPLRVSPMALWNSPRAGVALAALLLAGPAAAAAQEPLTLEQAVARALAQSRLAETARANRDASRYRDNAFYSRQLPRLTLGGTVPSYNRAIIPVLQPDGSTSFRPQDQVQGELTATMAQTLPLTGGDFFVSSALSRLSVSGQQTTRTWSSTPVEVGLRQPLFRSNDNGWDRKEQPLRAEVAERQYREAREDIALETANLFFDVHAAQVALRNAEANAATNDTLYTRSEEHTSEL